MAPVTSFATWDDLVTRGWGTMRRTGNRWDFVPQLDQMVTVAAVTGKVHRRVAPLAEQLLSWLVAARGRDLDPIGNWGLALRPIRGREAMAYAGDVGAWSNHSAGIAVDIEAPRNPMGAPGRGDFPTGWLEECHRWGFAWGAGQPAGDYRGRPDRMHIEFVGTPAQADDYVALLARTTSTSTSSSSTSPQDNREDDPVSAIPITVRPDGSFAETVMVEAGTSSAVIDQAWLTFGTAWAGARFDVYVLDAAGRVMGPAAEKHVDLAVNRRDFLPIPSGAVLATIAGTVAAGGRPAAALVVKPKPPGG